jgi:hypothetical protein
MASCDVLRHLSCRYDEILEWMRRTRFGDAAQNPEERLTEVTLGLHSHATGLATRDKGFNLDMDELRPEHIATKYVGVWRIPQSDYSAITAPTELTGHKKLAGIAARALIPFRHIDLTPI